MISLLFTLTLCAAPEPGRFAVLVGSNTSVDGRSPLRFAHRDAAGLRDVLVEAGGFDPHHVVLLTDPTPKRVLEAIDATLDQAAQVPDAMFVFFYSGHADDRALYPGGAALPLDQLKSRLATDRAGVRIGVIDSCRGGGWTQSKGLVPTESFALGVPQLASEGTALLASSSGLEDAHETESLQGSFFTHHLVAGLRGAADESRDGQVTLTEAFTYANRLTIRDTSTRAPLPQHPSFDLRLRGRHDVVLTQVGQAGTRLDLEQSEGPLEVVQLSTGVVVVEAPAGKRSLRIAVAPGAYVVRRVTSGGIRSREVQVLDGESTRVEEASLLLVGASVMAAKAVASPQPQDTVLVHLRAPPSVQLQRVASVGSTMVGSEAVTITNVETVCVAPCDQPVDRAATHDFLLAGEGVTPSAHFSLMGHGAAVDLRVTPGDQSRWLAGRAMAVMGPVAALAGVGMVTMYAVISGSRTAQPSDLWQPPIGWLLATGLVSAVIGAVVTAIGIPWALSNRTQFEFAPSETSP